MAKKKPFELTVKILDERAAGFIMNCFAILNHYRAREEQPAISFAQWVYDLVIRECNAIAQIHSQNMRAAEESRAAAEESAPESESQSEEVSE